VVLVGKPLRLARMVAALQKAAGMLSWQGGSENAPRLARAPAPAWAAQPGAAPYGGPAAQAASAAGQGVGGGAGGGGGGGGSGAGAGKERWRMRASIDNSALQQSPHLRPLPPLPDLSPPPPPPQQQQHAAPPPLDLAGAPGAAPAEAKQPGAVMRGLRPLTTAVKSVFMGASAAAQQQQQQQQQRQQQQQQQQQRQQEEVVPPPVPQQQQPPAPLQQQEAALAAAANGADGSRAPALAPLRPRVGAAALPPQAPTTQQSQPQAGAQQQPLQLQSQPQAPPLQILIAEDNRVRAGWAPCNPATPHFFAPPPRVLLPRRCVPLARRTQIPDSLATALQAHAHHRVLIIPLDGDWLLES
jgi:hypothetical protein